MESGLAARAAEGEETASANRTEIYVDAFWKRLVRPIPITIIDLLSLTGLFVLAEYIVNRSALINEMGPENSISHTALSASFIAVSIALLWALRFRDSYNALPNISGWMRIVGVVSFASMLSALVWLVFFPKTYDQLYIVLTWTLAVLGLPLGEYTAQKIKRIIELTKPLKSSHTPVIIVGSPSSVSIAKQRFEKDIKKYELVATVDLANGNGKGQDSQNMTELMNINRYAESNGGVLVATTADKYTQLKSLFKAQALRESDRVRVALYPSDNATSDENVTPWQPKKFSWWYEKFRRGVDVTIASLSLLMASPLILLISLLIKLDSRGPILFSQTRVGRGGQLFNMHKFRSMCHNAENMLETLADRNEANGHMFKIADDPRLTRVGRVIRRLSLDEIPQLLNVLQGSMSIVGPRPPLPHEVKEYQPWHFRRFEATPGITGLWQIKRGAEINFDEMVRLDIYYIENWSLMKDAEIILKTLPAMLRGQGAY